MKLIKLLEIANKGYTDGFLKEYYDINGNPQEGYGDGLAKFIVAEITETFKLDEPEKTYDEEQIDEAIRVMEIARDEISGIINALGKWYHDKQA